MLDTKSILLALFVAFLWGVTPILMRYCSRTLNYTTIMVISGMFYIGFLSILIYNQRKVLLDDITNNVTWKTILYMMGSTFLGLFLANLIFHQLISVNEVYITSLTYTAPLFSVIIAYLVLGESICMLQMLGILLITIGIVCVVS
jgi:uncharacterized membrane protein